MAKRIINLSDIGVKSRINRGATHFHRGKMTLFFALPGHRLDLHNTFEVRRTYGRLC